MKTRARVVVVIFIFLVATAVLIALRRVWRHRVASTTDDRIPLVNVTGQVTLRFAECAGSRALFLFENGTDYPIYARVHPADFWKEFKEANLQYGLHKVYYKAPNAPDFKYVGPMFDAVDSFRPIMPHETVRYGVDLWKGSGEYKVTVPYMEDAEIALRLNEDFVSIIKQDLERVKASWKEASSEIVVNTCQ
jgi:hypothetical protein